MKAAVQTQEDFRPRCGLLAPNQINQPHFQEWNLHKDREADDHQNNQDDDPAVTARGLEFAQSASPSICRIIITPVFVITYPNLTKMKRHVWYWYFRVPVSFPNV